MTATSSKIMHHVPQLRSSEAGKITMMMSSLDCNCHHSHQIPIQQENYDMMHSQTSQQRLNDAILLKSLAMFLTLCMMWRTSAVLKETLGHLQKSNVPHKVGWTFRFLVCLFWSFLITNHLLFNFVSEDRCSSLTERPTNRPLQCCLD